MSTTHTIKQAGNSQCDRILATLIACRGMWVAMPSLVAASGAYAVHSRISDLRKRGHNIDQISDHTGGGCRSFYRLNKLQGEG